MGHWASLPCGTLRERSGQVGIDKRQGRQGRGEDKGETFSIIPPCPPCLFVSPASLSPLCPLASVVR